jgi:uncharacterized protein DUF3592
LKDKLQTLLFCLAFALPFGGVGAGAAYVIYHSVKDGIRAQDWVRVKADLQGFGPGTISYQYMIDGKRYHGDRLGTNILGGTDDVDDFHDRVREHLSEAQSNNKPITVWVNPDDPSESMFDRDIRWKLMMFAGVFALAFGGVGVGALVFAAASLLPESILDRLKNSKFSGVGTLWIFAFFWNVLSFPIAILAVPDMLAEGNWFGLLILIFPLIGVLLLWGAVQGTWQAIRGGGAQAATRVPAKPKPKMVELDDVEPSPPATAMADEPMPVALGPGFEKVEEMLSGAGVKLTSQQMRVVHQISPEHREMVAKLFAMGPTLRKILIWGVVIYFVLQLVPGIITLLME